MAKMREERGGAVTVPAGTYFLGDPCYAVPDGSWMELLNSCGTFNQPIGSVGRWQVVAFGTAYGDGTYRDQWGHEYSVDAGLIGLTPERWCGKKATGGQYVKFDVPVRCEKVGGVLRFGQYLIDTDPEDDPEDC